MRKNKLLIAIGAAVLIGIVSLLAYRAQNQRASDGAIRIGVILPLTGDLSVEGEKSLAAVKLAAAEVNSVPTQEKIKLIVEDGKFTKKDSLSAFNRMRMSGVDAIVAFGTPCTLALQDQVTRAEIPMLAIDGTDGLSASSPWIFSCLQSMTQIGAAAGEYLSTDSKVQKVSLVVMNGDSGLSFAKGFKEKCGTKIVCEETFPPDAQDVRSIVQKAIFSGPDAVCVFGYGAGYLSMLNQLQEARFGGVILTDVNVTSVLDKIKNNGSGIKYVSLNFGPESTNQKSKDFIDKIKTDYGIEPSLFAAFAYEGVKMLAMTASEDRSDPETLRKHLQELRQYDSVVGIISYNENRELDLTFNVFTIK